MSFPHLGVENSGGKKKSAGFAPHFFRLRSLQYLVLFSLKNSFCNTPFVVEDINRLETGQLTQSREKGSSGIPLFHMNEYLLGQTFNLGYSLIYVALRHLDRQGSGVLAFIGYQFLGSKQCTLSSINLRGHIRHVA